MYFVIGIIVILTLCAGLIGIGFVLVNYFKQRQQEKEKTPPKGEKTPPKPAAKTQTWSEYFKEKKWLKWVSGALAILLVLVFLRPLWSGATGIFETVASQTGVTELLLVLSVVVMLATFFVPQVRGDNRWPISYCILVGMWLLIWAHFKSVDYKHGISFMQHLRPSGLVALWLLLPACAVAIYLVKNKWVKAVFVIAALVLFKMVGTDFNTSPRTVEVNVMRGAPPSAQVAPYDISTAKWEWEISYSQGFDEWKRPLNDQFTNDIAIVRNDDKFMSVVEKLPNGRFRYYEWVKNEYYGSWREENPLQKGRFRFERRDKRNYSYYDGIIIFDAIGRSLPSILKEKS